MAGSQNFGHEHPLLPLNEEPISNQSGVANCSMCGEKVSAPCFSCAECCGFYLHKVCAEAPSEINHPFHQDHPLVLQNLLSSHICDFCDEGCRKFVYCCRSCDLDLHIKCAFFTYNIAEKNLKELEHVALEDPLISTKNDDDKQLAELSKCFGCWEPLANYSYFSLDCGFNLHKKCAELPLKIPHLCHHKRPLVLQFNNEWLSCKICQERIKDAGFVYGCSPCKFGVHIECSSSSPPPVIEDKSHQHPFILIPRRAPFICDACGTEGIYSAYICCTCKVIVHKKCISLPRIIKSKWHDHRIFHTYFLQKDFRSLDCIICHDEVHSGHGSYSCSYCDIIFHVNCVTENGDSYSIVSLGHEEEKSSESLELLPDKSVESIAGFFQRKNIHNLMLSDKTREYDRNCDGCMLPISDSFYYCLQCDFFLHRACAELPMKKDVWHHGCHEPLIFTSDKTFGCGMCGHLSNAFAYTCNECKENTCLRCVIALNPGAQKCSKHEHPLPFYIKYEGPCRACGDDTEAAFHCKDCNFALDLRCFSLPITARHKCDEHLFALNYHDNSSYPKSHFCDICEESRDPNNWFYHCATCDTSAHINCVLGRYPFIKLGSTYEDKEEHPHPLTFVKKIYYHLDCVKCHARCEDVALECTMPGCNYIVHCHCIESYYQWW